MGTEQQLLLNPCVSADDLANCKAHAETKHPRCCSTSFPKLTYQPCSNRGVPLIVPNLLNCGSPVKLALPEGSGQALKHVQTHHVQDVTSASHRPLCSISMIRLYLGNVSKALEGVPVIVSCGLQSMHQHLHLSSTQCACSQPA